MPFLNLNRNIVYSRGFTRAAIYDLNTRQIFWLTSDEAQLMDHLMTTEVLSFSEEERRFVDEITTNRLFSIDSHRRENNDHLSQKPVAKISKAWLELDTGCNHRCIHCYNSSSPSNRNKELELRDLQKYATDLKECGVQTITVIGGEPLTHRDLLENLLKFISTLHFKRVIVYSNGTLIDQRWADTFKANRIYFSISIYGHTPQIHESVTLTRGSFNDTVRGIDLLMANPCDVGLNVIVTPQNEEQLPEILKGLSKRFPGLPIEYDYLRPVGRGIAIYKQLSLKYLNRFRNFETYFDGPDEEKFLLNKYYHPCLNDKVMVNGKGEVSNCIMNRDISGNLKSEKLANVVSSKQYKKIQELALSKMEGCADCEFKYACDDCRPIATSLSGNLYAKPPECRYDPYNGIVSQ